MWPLVGKQHRKASKPNKPTLVELCTEARLKSQLIWTLLENINKQKEDCATSPLKG